MTVTVGGDAYAEPVLYALWRGYTWVGGRFESGGSATFSIPAGTLQPWADTLTAAYTPDTNSSPTYTSATGMNSITWPRPRRP